MTAHQIRLLNNLSGTAIQLLLWIDEHGTRSHTMTQVARNLNCGVSTVYDARDILIREGLLVPVIRNRDLVAVKTCEEVRVSDWVYSEKPEGVTT
jgi:hypothetical protein